MAIRDRITQFVTYLVKQIKCSQGGILIGRVTGEGKAQEITVGSGLTLSGTTLTVTGGTFAAASHTHVSSSITDAVSDATVEGSEGKLLKTANDGSLSLSFVFADSAQASEMTVGSVGTNGVLWILGNGSPGGINNANQVNGLQFSLPTTSGNLAVTDRTDGAVSYNDLVDVPTTVPLTSSKVVANAAARLALTTEQAEGFAVVDADTGKTWMLVAGGTPATSSDWLQLGDRDIQAADIADSSAAGRAMIMAADASEQRVLIKAQSSEVAFLDRFDRSDRYDNPDALTHLVSMPEVGPVWRLNTPSGTPTITAGAFYITGNSLCYLGSSVPSPNGKFSLSYDFEFASTAYALTGTYRGFLNVTFGALELIGSDGGIATGLDQFPIHISFDDIGVTSISFYHQPGSGSSVPIPCVNAALESGRYQWIGGNNPIAWNKRHTLVVSVDGDEITISIPGVSHLVFWHADVSTKVGSSDTSWWWEVGGESQGGNQYQTIAKLYRVWSSEKLNQDPGWLWAGNLRDLAANGTHKLPGKLLLYPNNGSRMSAETPPTYYNEYSGGVSVTAKGSNSRINGGHIIAEGGFVSGVGLSGAGNGWGRAPIDMDMGIDTAVSSSAGTNTTLKSFYQAASMENGDMEILEFAGNLVGTSAKRIWLQRDSSSSVFFDSDASGTPLTSVTGPWTLTVQRNVTSASSYCIATFIANGVQLVQRLAANFANNDIDTVLRANTVSAGGVTLEFARRQVIRVNIN